VVNTEKKGKVEKKMEKKEKKKRKGGGRIE
jgi:hypothetical protein